MFLVRLRTMLKNRIHILVDRPPELSAQAQRFSDLFGKAGWQWLAEVSVPGVDAELLAEDLGLREIIEARMEASDGWVSQLSRREGRARPLGRLPGIGDFLALLPAVEIDDVRRFCRAQKLCAYAGVVPSTYASGGYVHHGRITKQGNKWIRWACIEAVYPAIRKDPALAAMYERLKAAKGANVAKVAVAKRLLTIAYRLLTEGRP